MPRVFTRFLFLALVPAIFVLAPSPALAAKKIAKKVQAKKKLECPLTYATLVRAPKSGDTLEVGEAVTIKLKGEKEAIEAYFVGKMQNQIYGEAQEELVFLEGKTNVLWKIAPDLVAGMEGSNGLKIPGHARVIHGIEQLDGTCGAHAITNCVVQLGDILPHSPERRQLFNRAKILVYESPDWLRGATTVLRENNIPYEIFSSSDPGAEAKLLNHLNDNKPAYYVYAVGAPDHSLQQRTTKVYPFSAKQAGQTTEINSISWRPGAGEGHTNPHAVMLAKQIPTKEGTKLIVLDSNQRDLRVWELPWLRKGSDHIVVLAGIELDQPAELAKLSQLVKLAPEDKYLQKLVGGNTEGWEALSFQDFLAKREALEKKGAAIILEHASASIEGPKFRLSAGDLQTGYDFKLVLQKPGADRPTSYEQEIYRVFVRKKDLPAKD